MSGHGLVEMHEAYEVVRGGSGSAGVVLTCEHASERLPAPWTWSEGDERLIGTHWALDIGAAAFTREFAGQVGADAVLARFSRLLIDPNRVLTSTTLFREVADGEPIALNQDISDDDAARRVEGYYKPFHAAVDRVVGASSAGLLFSVHSFTPLYEGVPREIELGVLFDDQPELAAHMCELFRAEGYNCQLNEPWSGRNGMMYSALHHGTKHGKAALEIEMRQDLSGDRVWRRRFARTLEGVMRQMKVL